MSGKAQSIQSYQVVGESWRHFETDILPHIATGKTADVTELSRMSFYFGAMMMLNVVQPLSERATRDGDLPRALAAFKGEIEQFLLSRTKG